MGIRAFSWVNKMVNMKNTGSFYRIISILCKFVKVFSQAVTGRDIDKESAGRSKWVGIIFASAIVISSIWAVKDIIFALFKKDPSQIINVIRNFREEDDKILKYSDGTYYIGKIFDNLPNGKGRLIYPSGLVLEGRWTLGTLDNSPFGIRPDSYIPPMLTHLFGAILEDDSGRQYAEIEYDTEADAMLVQSLKKDIWTSGMLELWLLPKQSGMMGQSPIFIAQIKSENQRVQISDRDKSGKLIIGTLMLAEQRTNKTLDIPGRQLAIGRMTAFNK